jgi:hypothetical protein
LTPKIAINPEVCSHTFLTPNSSITLLTLSNVSNPWETNKRRIAHPSLLALLLLLSRKSSKQQLNTLKEELIKMLGKA